eukprot:1150325-Pelagomonas_calceolata.AAC.2
MGDWGVWEEGVCFADVNVGHWMLFCLDGLGRGENLDRVKCRPYAHAGVWGGISGWGVYMVHAKTCKCMPVVDSGTGCVEGTACMVGVRGTVMSVIVVNLAVHREGASCKVPV